MSETETVSAMPDGTFTMEQSSLPERVQQQDGSWKSTDSTLTSVAGSLAPNVAAVPVQFSAGGTGPVAKIEAPSGQWISETWSGGSLPVPSVSGNDATYPEVYPGVDLRLSATPLGMTELLVIKNAAAAANPALQQVHFGVDDGSLTTSTEAGGTVVAKSADGKTELTSTAATWWDSSATGASPEGPGGTATGMPLPTQVSDTQITVDASVAADMTNVHYPVYVDPPWTGGVLSWAYVDAAYPTTAYWKGGTLTDGLQHVGYIDGPHSPPDYVPHTTRSYWQMDTSRVENTQINSALLNTMEEYSYSCTPADVSLYTVNPFSSSTTWNTRPALAGLVDTETVAYGYSSACPAHTVGFNAKAAVQRAADAGYASINFALVASESSNSGWKKFDSGVDLIINYQPYPYVPYNRDVQPCFAVCGLGAIIHGPSPNQHMEAQSRIADSTPLDYTFVVCAGTPSHYSNCQAPYHLSNQTPGQDVTAPLPVGLTDGAWVWQVRACRNDNSTLCSGWSSWFNFTIDTVAPNAPVATSDDLKFNTSTDGNGAVGSPATFTIAPNGSADVWGYEYSSSSGYTALSKPQCPYNRTGTDTYVVCAGTTAPQTVVPAKASGHEYIYAIDKAGNVSAVFDGSYQLPATLPVAISHGWIGSDDNYAAKTTTVSDQASSSKLAMHLTIGSNDWLLSGSDFAGDPATDPTVDTAMPASHHSAVAFNGSTSEGDSDAGGTTAPVTMDLSNSATVAAWVKPNGTSTGTRVIMSQDSSSGYSLFSLEETATGFFQFCAATSTTSAARDCASTATQIQVNTGTCGTNTTPYAPSNDEVWLLVVGTWNAALHQLAVGTYAYDATGYESLEPVPTHVSCPAAHSTLVAPATAPIAVGRDLVAGTKLHFWNGAIADPLVLPKFMNADAINSLYASIPEFGTA